MLDLVVINGKLVDGTGNPWYQADIGVKDKHIVAIGRDLGKANRVIDAKGLVVAPGFIDIHAHSGASLLVDPKGQSAVRQGVTTQVIGNCGHSMFPVAEDAMPAMDYGKEPMTDLVSYAGRVREQGVGINVAPLVGHSVVRAAVMGYAARLPSADELEAMKRIVAKAMEDGAFGMSTGLIYPPGCFSDTNELVALAQVVAKYGGIYTSHIRNEREGVVAAVEEAIAIGERAGLPVQVSHHKAANRKSWGLVHDTLRIMEEARARGVDVTCDQYPYVATLSMLSIFLPHWAHDGGMKALLGRLRDVKVRQRILTEVRQLGKDWSEVVIIACPKHREWRGLSVAEIAELLGVSPEEAVPETLLAGDDDVQMVNFGMCEDDVITVMRHPLTMIGSDGLAVAPDGILGEDPQHPRSYGAFPRVLGVYVREKRVLTLEEAVRKMTSAPAQRLGLRGRGLLREGMRADITIFDPQLVADRATFTEPHLYPVGIEVVLINGEVVIEGGHHTERLPGEVLQL